MSKLEKAICGIVEVFEEFAGKDADKKRLSKSELACLVKSQLTCPDLQGKVHECLERIDKNHDGQVSFTEFSQFIANLSQFYFSKKYCQAPCKGK